MDSNLIIDYFSTINPIAEKIQNDINEIKSSYHPIWNDLSMIEQNDIISESIIKPEIALKYFDNFSSSSSLSSSSLSISFRNDIKQESQNKLKDNEEKFDKNLLTSYKYVQSGQKVINDEVCGAFRDEHSAPFSYKTKSQQNLNIFIDEINGNTNDCNGNTNNKKDTQMIKKKLALATSNPSPIKPPNYSAMKTFTSPKNSNFSETKSSTKYEKIENEESPIDVKDIDIQLPSITKPNKNFLSKLITKNSNLFNKENSNNATDEQNAILDNFDGQGVSSSNYTMNSLSSSIPSEEDEDKNCEFKHLLENDLKGKGYDFLANW